MALAMLAATSLTSCSDFLEAENKVTGGQTADDFFSSNPSALLYSSFANLKSVVNQVAIFDEGTDLYINTRGHNPSEFGTYAIPTNLGGVQTLYVRLMGTVNYANGVIKYSTGSTKETFEARFLRDYAYYMLTQHFGAVPYLTTYVETANREYPRTPLSEVYANVIEDLTDLYNNSSLADKSAHDGHVSKQAVAALLAKVELAAGWDLDVTVTNEAAGTYTVNATSHFTEASTWAGKALNGVSLYGNFNDKWLPANEATNKEEIFSIMFERTGLPGSVGSDDNNLSFTYGGYPTGTDKSGLKYVNSDFQQSAKSMALFEKGDARYEGTFMTTFYDGETLADGYMAYYNGANPDTHKINARWYPSYMTAAECEADLNAHKEQYKSLNAANSFKAVLLDPREITVWTLSGDSFKKATQTLSAFNAQTNNGTCVKKFDDPSADYNDASYRNIVLLHASQMYLVAAEANLMAGNAGGFWSNINTLRNRAGLASLNSIGEYAPLYDVTAEFGATKELDLLLDERARECYAEQTRWEDLRRTKQLVRYNLAFNDAVTSISQMQGPDGNVKWYRPIPDNEINYNNSLTQADQNPGYVKVGEE